MFVYTLTNHAQKRIVKRQILVKWIEAALTFPAKIEVDENDPALIHALLPIPEHSFCVLRVIYNETTEPIAVVTAYFDNTVKDL